MELKETLIKHNFKFKKSLGQNFITDTSLLDAIVRDAGIESEDTVIEVGAGGGTLTKRLASIAKKVVSFEVDSSLIPVLNDTLIGLNNIEVVFKDILKLSDKDVEDIVKKPFKVVANLPYYITTPLIMRFLESGLNVKSVTVTVQKEVAERLCAAPNTPEYGAITLQVKLKGDAQITRIINRKSFYPAPNVDSAVVRIDIKDINENIENDKKIDKQLVSQLIKTGFKMRRKTLANNLSEEFKITKDQAKDILIKINLKPDIRGEVLDLNDYINLHHIIKPLMCGMENGKWKIEN